MWKKVIVDTLKAKVPFKNNLRQLQRRFFPYQSVVANDEFAFQQGLEILDAAIRRDVPLDTILEFGTGWVPTIPMIFKAAGAKKIILTDIEPLMDGATMQEAKRFVTGKRDQIAAAINCAPESVEANLNAPDTLFTYLCPFDPAHFAPHSVDFLYSRTVLEHIPEANLSNILGQLKTIMKPDGKAIHIIDNSDHFEHTDKSLSRLNFLKYSDAAWRLICANGQNIQNRLRHSDYLKLFPSVGYDIHEQYAEVHEPTFQAIDKIKLHERFHRYSPEDLATITSTLVLGVSR
ncbi:MAG: class I SAM-dependent methyltransferase [Alphaproteobacteria bacterium]|nr:class I SAM-dependent methyltransferase [Alphaproteobacteria bacterium]